MAIKEESCFGNVKIIWCFRNKKTGILYKADDHIMDEIAKNDDNSQFDEILVVSNDLILRENITIGRNSAMNFLKFIDVVDFRNGKF